MTVPELLAHMKADGLDVLVPSPGKLRITGPAAARHRWAEHARAAKEDLLAYLTPEPDSLAELRVFCPRLWDPVTLHDGRSGLLWGVTARGVSVLSTVGPILTMVPERVSFAE